MLESLFYCPGGLPTRSHAGLIKMSTTFQVPPSGTLPGLNAWHVHSTGVVLWHVTPFFAALGLSENKTAVMKPNKLFFLC